jgi:thymidylate kinase
MSIKIKPLRISVVGIDGSGKSTTTFRAIETLGKDFTICRTGRPPCIVSGEKTNLYLPRISNFFEKMFKEADVSRNSRRIILTRLLFIQFQSWLEPRMVRAFRPHIVMSPRCMVLDPAVYSQFYFPSLAHKLSISSALKLSQLYCRLPFRHLYFYLNTPVSIAMERIYKRISKEHPDVKNREYWLHLHEHEEALNRLNMRFRKTLEVAQKISNFKVIEIDTEKFCEEEVFHMIAEYSKKCWNMALDKDWITIP